jgi:hypothetical protein
MRYAHLAPGYLSEEVKRLDPLHLGTEAAKMTVPADVYRRHR